MKIFFIREKKVIVKLLVKIQIDDGNGKTGTFFFDDVSEVIDDYIKEGTTSITYAGDKMTTIPTNEIKSIEYQTITKTEQY